MAGSVNKVILVGNLGAIPRSARSIPATGSPICARHVGDLARPHLAASARSAPSGTGW